MKKKLPTVHLINKLIDSLDGKLYDHKTDLLLHFINESILHKDPLLFAQNFIRYELRRKRVFTSRRKV